MELGIVVIFFAVVIWTWLRSEYRHQTGRERLVYIISIGISLAMLTTKIIAR